MISYVYTRFQIFHVYVHYFLQNQYDFVDFVTKVDPRFHRAKCLVFHFLCS
jgi:hypothetical protein